MSLRRSENGLLPILPEDFEKGGGLTIYVYPRRNKVETTCKPHRGRKGEPRAPPPVAVCYSWRAIRRNAQRFAESPTPSRAAPLTPSFAPPAWRLSRPGGIPESDGSGDEIHFRNCSMVRAPAPFSFFATAAKFATFPRNYILFLLL